MKKTFAVVIEKDEDGYFVASVPELPGCHTQAKTREELMPRVKEVIGLCLEADKSLLKKKRPSFVGLKKVSVAV